MQFSPLRKLAIRLACLHEDDRSWLLQQLGVQEQEQLNELLAEIEQLGLAADPAIVASVMAQPADPVLSEQSAAVKDLAIAAVHPFWSALVVQGLAPDQRHTVMTDLPRSAQARQFDSEFQRSSIPPELVKSLHTYLKGNGAK